MYYKLGPACVKIGAALFYYKLRQTLLQIEAVSLLQIGASVVANWGSYYKLEQPLLQNRAVLQIRTIITNWEICTLYVGTYGTNKNIISHGRI